MVTTTMPGENMRDRRERFVVCPHCDALYRVGTVDKGKLAHCARCHTILAAPRRKAGLMIVSLAVATLVLIFAAIFFPFLTLEVQGFRSSSSLLDIAFSFSDGILRVLILLMIAVVLAVPSRLSMNIFQVRLPENSAARPVPAAPTAEPSVGVNQPR